MKTKNKKQLEAYVRRKNQGPDPYVTPLDNLHGMARRFRKDLLRYHDPAHGGQIVPLTELERRYLAGELAAPQHKALYAALAAEHGPTTIVDRLSGLTLRITKMRKQEPIKKLKVKKVQ